MPEESHTLLDIVESESKHSSTIFYTQYETKGKRNNQDPETDSSLTEPIINRIIYNSYQILIDSTICMLESSEVEGRACRRQCRMKLTGEKKCVFGNSRRNT